MPDGTKAIGFQSGTWEKLEIMSGNSARQVETQKRVQSELRAL